MNGAGRRDVLISDAQMDVCEVSAQSSGSGIYSVGSENVTVRQGGEEAVLSRSYMALIRSDDQTGVSGLCAVGKAQIAL